MTQLTGGRTLRSVGSPDTFRPMKKTAPTDHPVHALIADRWSPYGFSARPIPPAELRSILEAARWAPSSYNDQPWIYLLATKADAEQHGVLVSCLVEGNRGWATTAPVLLLGLTRRISARNGEPNAACEHDLGLASANLSLEATSRGISVHQMSGILRDRIREVFSLPDDITPVTALALGYCAAHGDVPENLVDRHTRPRERRALASFIFTGGLDQPAPLED